MEKIFQVFLVPCASLSHLCMNSITDVSERLVLEIQKVINSLSEELLVPKRADIIRMETQRGC